MKFNIIYCYISVKVNINIYHKRMETATTHQVPQDLIGDTL